MRIKENPFYILQINPWDTIEKIDDAAETLSFTDEDNEQKYENAKQQLVSPTKRLAAEVSWLYSSAIDLGQFWDNLNAWKSASYYGQILHDECADLNTFNFDDARENFILNNEVFDYTLHSCTNEKIADVICQLDNDFRETCKRDTVHDLLSTINDNRRRAGISICKDYAQCRGEVLALLNDNVPVLNSLLNELDDDRVVEITNIVAEKTIAQDKGYGQVIEKLIEMYSLKFSEKLKEYERLITKLIEKAHDYTEAHQLNGLCDAARKFDHMAQPIQLLLQNRGQSDLQKESVTIANKIRNLGIHYNNNSGLSELSLLLLNLEKELFRELPDFYDRLEKDTVVLKDIMDNQHRQQRMRGEALSYAGEWGLIFKKQIIMTPDSITYEDTSIPLDRIHAVSWGITKKNIGANYFIEIWGQGGDFIGIDTSREVYMQLTDKLWKATADQIIRQILTAFKSNKPTGFDANILDTGIYHTKRHLFSKDEIKLYGWSEIKVDYYNGELHLDGMDGKNLASIPFMHPNAHMLNAIVCTAIKNKVQRLSDLL